jgi:hypothetical protein
MQGDRTTPTAACPECGLLSSVTSIPPPWWARRRRWVQVGVVLVMASLIVRWGFAEIRPTALNSFVGGGGATASFPERRMTRADLESIAAGATGWRLARDLVPPGAFGGMEISAAFVAPSGRATDVARYGWPAQFLVFRREAVYEDVYARTNPSATLSALPAGWHGWTHIRRRIHPGGWRETRLIQPAGIAGSLVVVIMAYVVSALALRMARALGHEWASEQWVRRFVPVGVVLAGIILIAVLSLIPHRQRDTLFNQPTAPITAPIGLCAADVSELCDRPDADAILARKILDATAGLQRSGADVLILGWSFPKPLSFTIRQRSMGWPRDLIGTYDAVQTRTRRGEPLAGAGYSFTSDRNDLSIFRRWRGPPERVSRINVSLPGLCQDLLILCCAWMAAGGVPAIAGAMLRRRNLRRVARGCCVGCGYDLSGLSRLAGGYGLPTLPPCPSPSSSTPPPTD